MQLHDLLSITHVAAQGMSEENGEAQGQISNEAAGPTIVENEAQQGGTRAEEDGKKRKVALHVAYIGAGYAVSLQVKILGWYAHTHIMNGQQTPSNQCHAL